ncbi:hypothetical protein [Halodesulfovibrio sp. MK-HDV]|uniref:hypothetical protein n=1 Tax=Halodesulfovibrio sp. MK-HDV TaxID=2599925 RepID=UPI00136AD532|nr:hypothetical protein [Halodesulfovibrio sp. MK-HDV]KAF1073603.1 hypothetical protein MKHDV_03445 [Halodesulfovibrio sp. MK-HDV]
MLKSILAVLFNSGMDYHVSPNILEYFKGKETTTPWHFHLGPDPVIDLQDNDFNYHVICIEGNKETGSIIAYLRYFGILQCSVLLSESYNKSSFQHSYAINVHKGEAITAQFDMNLKNFNSNPDVCGLLIYLALKEALGLFVIDKTTIENTLCSVLAKHQLTKSQLTLKNFDPIFNTALCNLLVHTPSFALTNTGVDFLTSKHNSLKIKHKLMRQLTKNFEEIFPSPQEQTQSIKPAS